MQANANEELVLTLLCYLAEEIASRQVLHDEELVGAVLNTSLESHNAREIRDELVQPDFAHESIGIILAS